MHRQQGHLRLVQGVWYNNSMKVTKDKKTGKIKMKVKKFMPFGKKDEAEKTDNAKEEKKEQQR